MQSKEFEIHLQIGESLVLCVEGVNSNENRDLWTELPKEVSLNACETRITYHSQTQNNNL